MPVEIKANPYASGAATPDSGFEGAPKERSGRNFRFNPKGKYVQIANQMRQEAQLEQLKQRIAESAKKAGLDSEFETLEKNIRVSLVLFCSTREDRVLICCCSASLRPTRSGGTQRSYRPSHTRI